MTRSNAPAPEGSTPGGRGPFAPGRRLFWVVVPVLALVVVLAVTVNFRAASRLLAALLVLVAVLRGMGRPEAEPFAARGKLFDVVLLALGAAGLLVFSVIASD